MMGGVLARVLDMSWTAGVVIVLVLAARAVLRRAPRRVICLLWLVVIFRLLCPVTLESAHSLLPVNSRPVSEGVAQITTVSESDMVPAETAWEPVDKAEGAGRQLTWLDRAAWLWLAGVAVMTAHGLWSFGRLRRQLTSAVPEGDGLYRLRGPAAPFVLGIVRPKIYLPDDLTETEERYILLHERMHIRRGDHVVKATSFAALCLHWFNPLVWLAFFALERDMEMACDEAVLARLGNGVKKAYSASLLRLAAGRQSLGAVPLAFGEGDTKSRVRHVLSYRKPLGWVAALLLLLAALAAVGLALDPPADELVMAEGEMALSDGRTARVQLVLEDAQVLARPLKNIPQKQFNGIKKKASGKYSGCC